MFRRFRPGVVPTLATALAVAILVSLGNWQVRRHAWREADLAAKNASIELPPVPIGEVLAAPEGYTWRRATARGVYDLEASVLVVNVPRGLRDGAHVLTPLLPSGGPAAGAAILVDRGWVPSGRQDEFLDAVGGGAGPVEVTGLVLPLAVGDALPGTAETRRLHWPHFDPTKESQVALLQAQLPYPLAPVVIQRAEDGGDEPPLGGFARPESPVDHRTYAVTWYSLAALAVATWVGLGVQQGRRPDRDAGGRAPA